MNNDYEEEDEKPIVPSPILRHEPRQSDFQFASGNEQNIEAISSHIEQHLGPIETVFHEIISDLVHIDVHFVAPSDKFPFRVLVTSGMSDRAMSAPQDDLRYAELVALLPRDWPLSQKDFENENHYWPLRWLKTLARLPHEYNTWLGAAHTVPNGDPARPFAKNTNLSGSILLPPFSLPEEFACLSLDDKRVINFYAMVPLYTEEMNFKIKNGADRLVDLMEQNRITDVIDSQRANMCRKRRWFLG